MTGARRKGIIICGNGGDFTDDDIDSIVQSIEDNNAVPIRGKTATIKGTWDFDLQKFQQNLGFPLKSVRRLSFANNQGVSNPDKLAVLLEKFPNLNELDVSNTKMERIKLATISKNNNLFHLKALNSPAACFETDVQMKLEMAMRKNMKRFILL